MRTVTGEYENRSVVERIPFLDHLSVKLVGHGYGPLPRTHKRMQELAAALRKRCKWSLAYEVERRARIGTEKLRPNSSVTFFSDRPGMVRFWDMRA